MVLANLLGVGPAVWALNAAAMAVGLLLGQAIGADSARQHDAGDRGRRPQRHARHLPDADRARSLPLALTQNIYGVVMLLNGTLAGPLVARPDRCREEAQEAGMNLLVVSAEEVARCLPYEECIPLMREAMIALSPGGPGSCCAASSTSSRRPRRSA